MECVGHFSFQGLVPWFPWFPHACAWEHFGVGAVFGWVAMVVAVVGFNSSDYGNHEIKIRGGKRGKLLRRPKILNHP